MDTVVRTIFNTETRENLKASFEHIRQTIVNLEHTTYNLDTLVYGQRGRMERILFNIESISGTIRENDQNITNILTNFSASVIRSPRHRSLKPWRMSTQQ
jgi:phospholipid/cholesterol/gamma-HCH transport system substrate-binding protein